MDLCGKSSGLADFENIVDGGSGVIFGADSGLCLSYIQILSPKQNLGHRSFFSFGRNVTLLHSFKLFPFSKEVLLNSGVRLLLELHCFIVIKYVAFFTIWAKLKVTFTYTN